MRNKKIKSDIDRLNDAYRYLSKNKADNMELSSWHSTEKLDERRIMPIYERIALIESTLDQILDKMGVELKHIKEGYELRDKDATS